MIIEIWNGQTPINGIPAEEILAERRDLSNALGDIFLVKDEYGVVSEIQIGRIIASNYKMDPKFNLQQIADQYLVEKERERQEAEEARLNEVTNAELQENIAMLSYDLMMMQPDGVATLARTGEHSVKFNQLKRWFKHKCWNEEMIMNAVIKGKLTEAEAEEIIANK